MKSKNSKIKLIAIFAVMSIVMYFLLSAFYPYDAMDRTEGFYNCMLVVKSVLFGSCIIATAIVLARDCL